MSEDAPRGLTSDELIRLLKRHHTNDVYVAITDADADQLDKLRVHDVTYDAEADMIMVQAHQYYR